MMSFQAFAITAQILLVLLIGLVSSVVAVYEHNPFLQNDKAESILPKDLNQINLAVIVPPGKEPFLSRPGYKPPSPPAPGYVWVQLPLSNTPVTVSTNKPPSQPSTQGPELQRPSLPASTAAPPATTTKPPTLVTIEPPGLLNGNNLSSKCLQPRGQFPSSSCNSYVNCWEGVAIEQTCPGGLLFNPAKLYCDYAENVDCQGKPIAATTTASPPVTVPSYVTSSSPGSVEASSTTAPVNNPALRKFCLRSTGLFPGSSCGKFVNCWGDNAVEQDCPEGLHFSSEGYCDYPENVGCGSQAQKVDGKSTECPLQFGNFRNRSNCSQYYTCAFYKVAATYNCPEGFSFSDVLGICDYSHRVDCTKEPQIYQKNINSNVQGNYLSSNAFAHPDLAKPAEVGDNRCIVSQGLVRDRDNCSMYYVCELGNVVASYVCPEGYKFSIELGVCDHKDKVNCNNPSRVYDPNAEGLAIPNIPKEILYHVQNCVPGSVFRLNPQCTSACNCRNGVAEIIQCSPGLAYDSQLDKCVAAHLARC